MALPLMVRRWPALTAGLLLGVLWTAWHLPFWIVLDELARFGWAYWLINLAFIMATSVYLTWVMTNTGHSVLLAVLAHWSFNVVAAVLPLTSIVPAYLIFTGLAVVAAVLVGARLRAEHR
jgi:membrane protease YdiL (CAAX protease family)